MGSDGREFAWSSVGQVWAPRHLWGSRGSGGVRVGRDVVCVGRTSKNSTDRRTAKVSESRWHDAWVTEFLIEYELLTYSTVLEY